MIPIQSRTFVPARTIIVAVILLLAGTSAYAQLGGAANVGGIVTDDSGAALPGVTVTITNTANGRAQSVVSGSDGRYRVVQLQPGPYLVSAELQGFSTSRRNVTLVVGSDAELNISLGVAAVNENVTVTGEAPLVE